MFILPVCLGSYASSNECAFEIEAYVRPNLGRRHCFVISLNTVFYVQPFLYEKISYT